MPNLIFGWLESLIWKGIFFYAVDFLLQFIILCIQVICCVLWWFTILSYRNNEITSFMNLHHDKYPCPFLKYLYFSNRISAVEFLLFHKMLDQIYIFIGICTVVSILVKLLLMQWILTNVNIVVIFLKKYLNMFLK